MSSYKHRSNFRTSFQFKLLLIFSLLTFLMACPLSIFYIVTEMNQTRFFFTDQLRMRTQFLARSVQLPLYAQNHDMLRQLVEAAAREPEIRAVVVTSGTGKVLAETHTRDSLGSTQILSHSVEVHSNPLNSIESSLTGDRGAPGSQIGTVRMERGMTDLSRALRQVIILSVSSAVVFWIVVTLLSCLVLRQVTRSFNALMQGIDAMQEGNFTSLIDIKSDDEPGRAAHAINELANVLQQRSEENIRLHEQRLDLERQMLRSQKLESLGVMAGGIAHDYNNLLQSILGNIELASRNLDLDSVPQKYITNAIKSGKHAADLTSMMLTYVGKGFIVKKSLNLNDLVRENTEMLKMAASTAVMFELSLAADLPAIIADEAHIQQVVMNLIINAKESILEPPGFVRLATGIQFCDQACMNASLLEEKPAPGRYVFLEVGDNGCGMNGETLKRLFDPFFTTKFAGRGLGMSAVMGIIRTHCGALFVESEPGKGTTFRALFPAQESCLSDTVKKPLAILSDVSTLQRNPLSGVVLVVDDEKSVLKICSKMVTICGFSVITACDGIDAVAKFQEHADEVVIVLMDLTMPNMDGITAMREMLCIRPDVKVILSSGFSEEELSERITDQSPSGFLRKPYSVHILETELRRVLQAE